MSHRTVTPHIEAKSPVYRARRRSDNGRGAMLRNWLVVVVASGCFTKPSAPLSRDAQVDFDALDAPDAKPSTDCTFGPPVTVIDGAPGLGAPAQSPSQLELFVTRQEAVSDPESFNLYRLTRWSTMEMYANLTIISELSRPNFADTEPAIAQNGLRAYFLSTRNGTNAPQVFQALRMSTSSTWGMPTLVSTNNIYLEGIDASADGRTLYFSEGTTIYKMTRLDDTDPFGAKSVIATGGVNPAVAGDGLSVYYHTEPLPNGVIYRQTRSPMEDVFQTPELITAGIDADISEDGRTLIYRSASGIAMRVCE
jgi:hypothetical protein